MSGSPPVEAMSATRLALTVRRLREQGGGLLGAEPIAIVGIGCRFPGGAHDPESYWRLLVDGIDAISEVPGDRFAIDEYYDPDPDAPGKLSSRHGGFLRGDPLGFDAEFFGISAREARSIDPQHRLLLEVAWEALENGGLVPGRLRGSRTGVYVGVMNDDYGRLQLERGDEPDIYSALGVIKSAASGRLSYLLGLRGPSFPIDTACSSSLVAVHLACESLRAETSDLALAAGVNLILSPEGTLHLSRLRALAADGRCKSFDARADGFVRSEGCGVVVLERLSDALAKGRRIHALIRGSAVNHDGPSSGLTVPSGPAQQEVIRAALAAGAVHPAQVGYLEAHGSGTSLGDPIEVDAAGAVLGAAPGRTQPLWLGSVKTNIGHLESAAGIAGLIKAALVVSRGELPPHLHLRALNPHIDATANRVAIPLVRTPWTAARRLAGVSAFGLTGTNAHVIVEAATPISATPGRSPRPLLVPLSARTGAALQDQARALRDALRDDTLLAPLAHTAARGRTHHAHRLALVAADVSQLREQLDAFLAGERRPGLSVGVVARGPAPRVVFVFPGQGSQWAGMARGLLDSEPVFAAAIDRLDAAISAEAGWSVRAVIAAGELPAAIDVLQPTLFAIQVALAGLWRALGVVPDAVVGHSMGEIAAAHVAGALSLEHAAAIVCRRSKLLLRIRGQGAMALVELTLADATAAIAGAQDRLSVAVSNGPRSTVIAGDPAALDHLLAALGERGVFFKRIKVDVASHSPQVDPLCDDLFAALAGVTSKAAEIAMWSTVTAAAVHGPELGPAYWVKNLRALVRFGEVVTNLGRAPVVFVEVSPHPILTAPIAEAAPDAAGITGTLQRDLDPQACLAAAAGALYTVGCRLDWTALHPGDQPPAALPTYAWQHERFAVEGPTRARPGAGHPLIGTGRDVAPSTRRHFSAELDLERLPWLADHRVHGTVLLPAAAHLEAALAASGGALADVEVREPFVLAADAPRELQLVLGEDRRFEIFGRRAHEPWQRHASGEISERDAPSENIDLAAIATRCSESIPATAHYAALAARGLQYGPRFALLKTVQRAEGEALATLRCDPELLAEAAAYVVHPAILDAAFQVMSPAIGRGDDDGATTFLPVAIGRLQVWRSPREHELRVHVRSRRWQDGYEADIAVCTVTGELLLACAGLRVRPLARADRTAAHERQSFGIAWRETVAPTTELPRRWLLLEDRGGIASALHDELRAAGRDVTIVALERLASETLRPVDVVVHTLALDAPTGLDPDALADAEALACHSLMQLVQTLVRAGHRDPPRLVVLTRGAAAIDPRFVDPSQAAAWGLARAIRHEHPELRCTCVDLDPARPVAPAAALVGDDEDQIALREDRRLVARLVHVEMPAKRHDAPAGTRDFRLETSAPGTLDALTLVEHELRAPGPDELVIEVVAAGLNFMDVLMALGAYPGQAPGAALAPGGECAGTVVARGEAVTQFAVGDAVVVAHPGAIARRITVPARFVAKAPAGVDLERAATLPLVFMTAIHGIEDLGRLRAGERVLIHAASGGVGLAAIAIARRIGAEIFATAGSEEKRAYVRSLGVTHVWDSRSTGFAAQLLAATDGEGVDVVLNSLSGEGLAAGLTVLRPHGRFIDLSKKDIYENSGLALAPFRRSLSFSAVDLAGMGSERPAMFAELLARTMARFAAGELAPLPVRSFAVADAAAAFFAMSRARHIGKLALRIDAAAQVLIRGTGTRLGADATYLITGGLGGLGLCLATWMVEHGARHLALIGRGAPSVTAEQTLATLKAAGAEVRVLHIDVTDGVAMAAAIAEIDAGPHPLRGVVHAAAVLDDSTLLRLDTTRFRRVMAPKVLGAAHLHRLTADRQLDFFVLFSSAAALLGSPGQGSYAAANGFLDALAQRRRGLGLPALSIDWGPWAEVGLAALAGRGEGLAYQGIESFSPAEGLAAFAAALASDATQVGLMRLDPRRWAQCYPRVAASAYLSELRWHAPDERASELGEQLAAAAPAERITLLRAHLREQVAHVLRTAPARIELDAPLGQLGMDSLTGLQLRNRLEAQLGLALAATLIWAHPTVAALAEHLLGELGLRAPAVAPVDAAREQAIATLAALSEDEAEALLLARLDDMEAKP